MKNKSEFFQYVDKHELYKQTNEDKPEWILRVFDHYLEGFGVEVVRNEALDDRYYGDVQYIYVNMGDMYVETVIYDVERNWYYKTTLGDVAELDFDSFLDRENALNNLPKLFDI